MFNIDVIEVLLGTLGFACSIYDPWIGDTRASILVTYARTAALFTLFGSALVALATLVPSGLIEVETTTYAILFFAVGGSAPTLARGAWSLIDMSTMFNDLLYLSYQSIPEPTDSGSGRTCNVGDIGGSDFVAWFGVVFWTLMKHNVSWERRTPYGPNLYRAFRNNWEAIVHGRSIHPGRICWTHAWKFGWEGWASRSKAFFNLVILNTIGFAFLFLQLTAALGEGLLLAVGSLWMSVAIAAQANGLKRDGRVAKTRALKLVVEELICCETCTHKKYDKEERAVNAEPNTKSYEVMMPKVKQKSMADRKGSSNKVINVCRCRFCTFGCACQEGWVTTSADQCGDCSNGAV
ncbi:unnamed protein product [Ectocarpus sp. CCAP 1310/34]|nr:unnamed protein product [Ectocarpus sp. CCAP 1310/34]